MPKRLMFYAAMLVATPAWTESTLTTANCPHCATGQAFTEFLMPESNEGDGPATDVHVLWPTMVEVVPITTDIGGWQPPSFHQKLAKEAIRGWRRFRDQIGPSLPNHHPLREELTQQHAGALNDAFFKWQKRLFEAEGDFDKSLAIDDIQYPAPAPDANSSWPEMNAMPEYRNLRRIVEQLSRRYLVRSGVLPNMAAAINYSVFNWAAIHGPGEFHGPHTHVGEFHVGVFYAQAGPAAGKLRFGDPRGHSPPFGRTYYHTPRSGELILFPSWLSHMATVTAASSDIMNKDKEPYRVVFSFNIGPVSGPLPCHLWWSDPTGDMRFQRRSKIDLKELGLE